MTTQDAHPHRHQNLLGIGLRVGAGVSFSLMAALIKLASDAGANTPEIIFYRNLGALLPILLWICWRGQFDAWRTRRPGAHLSRGVLGLTGMVFNFGALILLPLAEAVTLSFVAPFFSVILSALLLREPVGRHRWSAVAFGFLGVAVVMEPAGTALSSLGLASAVMGAIAVAGVTITIREIGRTESAETTVLWFTCFSVLVSGLLIPFFGQVHGAYAWVLLGAVGLFGGIGQLFLTASLRVAPVSVVVPFDYGQIIWAVLLGWVLWHTEPRVTTWLGAAIIVGSGLYTLYREHRLGRDRDRPEPL